MRPRPESIRNASAPPPLVPGALLAVDEVREPLRQAGENLLFLRCRQPSRGDGRIEFLLRGGLHGGEEPVDGLALVGGDLRERLARVELRAQLGVGEPEVGCGGGEGADVLEAETGAVAEAAAEERQSPSFDARLQRVTLLLRQPPGGDGRVDAVLERLLQRGGEGARLDAELLRGVVDDGLAVAGRPELRRSNRAAGASGGERRGDSGDDLAPDRANHASPPSSSLCAPKQPSLRRARET